MAIGVFERRDMVNLNFVTNTKTNAINRGKHSAVRWLKPKTDRISNPKAVLTGIHGESTEAGNSQTDHLKLVGGDDGTQHAITENYPFFCSFRRCWINYSSDRCSDKTSVLSKCTNRRECHDNYVYTQHDLNYLKDPELANDLLEHANADTRIMASLIVGVYDVTHFGFFCGKWKRAWVSRSYTAYAVSLLGHQQSPTALAIVPTTEMTDFSVLINHEMVGPVVGGSR
jgi:hypothetical protein